MLKVFNTTALSQKQRFGKAILFGSLASLVLLFVYVIVCRVMFWEFEILYIALGFAIGWIIQETGRGVQPRFSILAAILCFLVIFLGDLIVWFPSALSSVSNFFSMMRYLLIAYSDLQLNSLLSLFFRGVAIYCAYRGGRIV